MTTIIKPYSREIKFRAWDDVNDEMIYFDLNDRLRIIISDLLEKGLVMQFTGLKDKNGKEIYEGDILNMDLRYGKETIRRVFWNNNHTCYMYTGNICLSNDEAILSEIIGNIYENPELIK